VGYALLKQVSTKLLRSNSEANHNPLGTTCPPLAQFYLPERKLQHLRLILFYLIYCRSIKRRLGMCPVPSSMLLGCWAKTDRDSAGR